MGGGLLLWRASRDLDAGLTCYALLKAHWKTIRTTNVIERLYSKVKRRTKRVAAAFCKETCLLVFYDIIF